MVSKSNCFTWFYLEYPPLAFPPIRSGKVRMLADNRGFAEFLFEFTELSQIFHRNHIKIFVVPPVILQLSSTFAAQKIANFGRSGDLLNYPLFVLRVFSEQAEAIPFLSDGSLFEYIEP